MSFTEYLYDYATLNILKIRFMLTKYKENISDEQCHSFNGHQNHSLLVILISKN